MVAPVSAEQPLIAFVSGRIHDDTRWAREAVDEVLELPSFIVPWIFEHTPASSQENEEGYLEKVRDADLVIWLVETETTSPVRNEITTALKSSLPVLMFRITPGSSDSPTESLITCGGGRYDRVTDADDLKRKLHLALSDEIVRAWRKAGRSTRPALLSASKAHSRARCIERWLAVGVPLTIAERFANDVSIGLLKVSLFASKRLAILRAEIGAGKSLAAERVLTDALVRAENTNDEVPVFLEARQIDGTIAAHLEERNLHTGPDPSGLMVIDGLDEAPVGQRINLLREALRMTLVHRSLRVLVTCRPLPDLSPSFDEFVVDLEPLSKEESLALTSQVSDHPLNEYSLSDFPASFSEAIRRPLFAILAGVTQRDQTLSPLPQGRLLHRLVELSLGRVNAHQESADPLLRKLARMIMDRGGFAVPIAEVAAYAEVAPLLRSRLVVERDGRITFPLMILAEWFAARELELGKPAAIDLADDAKRLSQWVVPLQMCLSSTSEVQVSRLMQPLATRHPVTAAQLLDQAFLRWTWSEDDYQLPSWQECGAQLVAAMRAWTAGLGPLARLIAPVGDDGRLRTLGVRRDDRARLLVSWGRSESDGRVLNLPSDFRSHLEWRHSSVRWGSAAHSGWPWQWTREHLSEQVEELLSTRALPSLGALHAETRWRLAVRLARLPYDWKALPIPKEQLLKLWRPRSGPLSVPDAMSEATNRRVQDAIQELISHTDGDDIEPPWPGTDRPPGPYVWSGYLPGTILTRTRAVYEAALKAYFEAVNRWFPRFRDNLRTSTNGPIRMVGVIRRSPGSDDWFGGLVLHYYREACRSEADMTADFSLVDESGLAAFLSDMDQKFARGVIDNSTASVLDIFELDSAEKLMYSWLEDDLRTVGLLF